MSNSSTFRALPAACIEKARRYLALPNQEDDAKAEFKKASSGKLSDIFAGLNEALQELADSGQPLFITPLGPPDSEGNTPIKWERNASPITVKFDVLMEGPDAIPLDGKQTVDYLVSSTNDFVPTSLSQTNGYIFNLILGGLTQSKYVNHADVIEARKILGLSTRIVKVVDEPIGMTIYDLEHPESTRLSDSDVLELVNLVLINRTRFETLKETFGRIRQNNHKFSNMHPDDIHSAWTQLAKMQANKPKLGTTAVHAERCC